MRSTGARVHSQLFNSPNLGLNTRSVFAVLAKQVRSDERHTEIEGKHLGTTIHTVMTRFDDGQEIVPYKTIALWGRATYGFRNIYLTELEIAHIRRITVRKGDPCRHVLSEGLKACSWNAV